MRDARYVRNEPASAPTAPKLDGTDIDARQLLPRSDPEKVAAGSLRS
jgi:hypothetical protein